MRTFSCFITETGASTPTLSFILAEDVRRARELARRELLDARRPVSIEICEGGQVLWAEQVGENSDGFKAARPAPLAKPRRQPRARRTGVRPQA